MKREWIRSRDKLPDKETRYANEKSVEVLVMGKIPFICKYVFDQKVFLTHSYGPRGFERVPMNVKMWMPLPERYERPNTDKKRTEESIS